MSRMPWTLAGTLVALASPMVARAGDCDGLIKALEKGGREKRTAFWESSPSKGPSGKPIRVVTPEAVWELDPLTGSYQKLRGGVNEQVGLAQVVREGQANGKVKCRMTGSDTYLGAKVTKVHFNTADAPAVMTGQTLWIDDASGRPLYMQVDGGSGGFSWTYGADVKPPAP